MSGSGDAGFGPVGPVGPEGPPFAVAGPSQVVLDAARSGSGSFTVSNVTGRPVRARVLVLPGAGADAAWFQVVGESERALPVAGTATVDVTVKVAEKAAAGAFSFAVGAALEESPDQVVSGPTVAFQVAEPNKRKFPWWIVIVAVVAVLLLAGGGILIWNLTRPKPGPTNTPTPTTTVAEPSVFKSDLFLATPGTYFDLDTGQQVMTPSAGGGEDVFFYQGAGSGELGVVGQGPPRLAVVDQPTFAACEAATSYDDLNAQNIVLLPDRATFVCVKFTDQDRRSVMTIGPATGGGFPVSFTTWNRG
ncbi:hypothetical protein [Microbacterium deminutum]|uniref:Serine/threonine protein kinase n=1 Tax=Microbacterium deminutum TaxID=344164 RepID=A0ABP5C5W1_9MICO